MDYLVKNPQGEILRLTVVSGVPRLPEGFEIIGPEAEHNPNNVDLAVAVLVLTEVEPAKNVLVQEEILAVEEQPEKWTKEGEADVFIDPQDETWTHVSAIPAIPYQEAVYNTIPAVKKMIAFVDEAKVAAKTTQAAIYYTERVMENAMDFGTKLIKEFGAENIRLGITQAGKTSAVRKAMSEVSNAVMTGSLKDAMDEVRLIPADKKDAVFLTDARLLQFVNKIETYLGMPLSATL